MDEILENRQAVELPFGDVIFQSRNGQGISSEVAEMVDIVLENEPDEAAKVLELGTGCGIISIMLKHSRPLWNITGIEIQNHLVKLAQENSNICNISIDFMQCDLRKYSSDINYDIIISNPPYFKKSQGRISPNIERAIARHEVMCELGDIVQAIAGNLSQKGRAYLIYPENREAELTLKTDIHDMELDKIAEVSLIKKTRVLIYRIKKR